MIHEGGDTTPFGAAPLNRFTGDRYHGPNQYAQGRRGQHELIHAIEASKNANPAANPTYSQKEVYDRLDQFKYNQTWIKYDFGSSTDAIDNPPEIEDSRDYLEYEGNGGLPKNLNGMNYSDNTGAWFMSGYDWRFKNADDASSTITVDPYSRSQDGGEWFVKCRVQNTSSKALSVRIGGCIIGRQYKWGVSSGVDTRPLSWNTVGSDMYRGGIINFETSADADFYLYVRAV